jgi:hypothetical protein
VEFDQGVVHLCTPDPDGCLWRVWYPAAFDFPAYFLSVFCIILARLVNQADPALFLLMHPIANMYLIKLFNHVVSHYAIFQGFDVGVTTV